MTKHLLVQRVVLYARYSTDMQQERSVEDQFTLCREYAARQGWVVVGTYMDKERTSKTLHDRPGAIQMLRDASTGKFDIILTEHLDRLSRAGEDLYGIFNKLKFDRVQLHSVSQGIATEEIVGIYALTGQLFLKGLSEKVSRGMTGRAKEGKIVAGVTYGYKTVPGKPGERVIDPDEARIVERVFMEYIAGDSPRDIARRLEAEGIKAPGRTPWSWQNISGGRSTTSNRGIINNRMYLGEWGYGRTKDVFNPSTGKNVRRKGDNPVVRPHGESPNHLRRDVRTGPGDPAVPVEGLGQAAQAMGEEQQHPGRDPELQRLRGPYGRGESVPGWFRPVLLHGCLLP